MKKSVASEQTRVALAHRRKPVTTNNRLVPRKSMSTGTDALDHARAEAQALTSSNEEAATKTEAAIRIDLQAVPDQAQKPAHSVKVNADAQHRSEMVKTKS